MGYHGHNAIQQHPQGLGSLFGFHDAYHNQFHTIFPNVTYQLGMTY
jgi:hypothetical protein